MGCYFRLNLFVKLLAANLIGNFAPQCIWDQGCSLGPVYRDLITCHTNSRHLTRRRQQAAVNDPGCYASEISTLKGDMGSSNEGVGFAAAKGCFKPVNGRNRIVAGEPAEDLGEDHF